MPFVTSSVNEPIERDKKTLKFYQFPCRSRAF